MAPSLSRSPVTAEATRAEVHFVGLAVSASDPVPLQGGQVALRYIAATPGDAGNGITVEHVYSKDPEANEVVVEVDGTTITVVLPVLGPDPDLSIAAVVDAVNAHEEASALVVAGSTVKNQAFTTKENSLVGDEGSVVLSRGTDAVSNRIRVEEDTTGHQVRVASR